METNTATREDMAAEYVERTHMADWAQNDRRQELAERVGLAHHWQSHAAYREARAIAGLPG
jgi:hypothetical protein